MADPIQRGNVLIAAPAPTFTKFVVVEGTWKEKPALDITVTKDGNSETYNYTGADPGVDATADLVLKATAVPLKKLDVIVTTETAPRKFVVMEVETSEYGGKPLKQSVSLQLRDAVASALTVSP